MIRSPILHSLRSLFEVKFGRFLRFASMKAFSKHVLKRSDREGEVSCCRCCLFSFDCRQTTHTSRKYSSCKCCTLCASISSSFVFIAAKSGNSWTCFRKSSSSISSSKSTPSSSSAPCRGSPRAAADLPVSSSWSPSSSESQS